MKLQGKVLKNFNDKKTGKTYKAKDDYKEADLYVADRERYEELYNKGFVEKGKIYQDTSVLNTKKKEEN